MKGSGEAVEVMVEVVGSGAASYSELLLRIDFIHLDIFTTATPATTVARGLQENSVIKGLKLLH